MTIHATATIDVRAEVDPTAIIGPNVVIDGPVQIGANCRIGPSAVVLGNTVIGAGCQIHSHAVIGDVPQDHGYHGADSYCRIGEQCIIREGATVHRGTAAGSGTTIGSRCYLMTNCHVAHNCEIGDDVTLVSGSLLAGHVRIGPRAVVSGNAAIHQFVRVGELAMVSGLAKIVQDVPPYLMTDRDGAVVAENRVGMSRAGLSPAERKEIKVGFGIIYRSGMGHQEAIEYLAANLTTAAGRTLIDFVAAGSKRGMTRSSLRIRRAA